MKPNNSKSVPVIDVHNHIGFRVGKSRTAEELISMMDRDGVDYAVVFPWSEDPDNDYVAHSVLLYPQRLIGFAAINPWLKTSMSELKRAIEEIGLVGLKLHPFINGYPLDWHELMDPFFQYCSDHHLTILSHGTGDNPFNMPQQFEEMAKSFPDVNLIMAHCGFMFSSYAAARAGTRCPNLYYDTSATTCYTVSTIAKTVGTDRILMAAEGNTFRVEMAKIDDAISDPTARQMIKGGNAAALFLKTIHSDN